MGLLQGLPVPHIQHLSPKQWGWQRKGGSKDQGGAPGGGFPQWDEDEAPRCFVALFAPVVLITVVSDLWVLGQGVGLAGVVHSGRCLGHPPPAFCWWGWTMLDQMKTPSRWFTTSSTPWGKSSCFKPSPKLSLSLYLPARVTLSAPRPLGFSAKTRFPPGK